MSDVDRAVAKLRKLDEKSAPAPWHPDTTDMILEDNQLLVATMRNSLPQFVALMEAVDAAHQEGGCLCHPPDSDSDPICDANAALVKAVLEP